MTFGGGGGMRGAGRLGKAIVLIVDPSSSIPSLVPIVSVLALAACSMFPVKSLVEDKSSHLCETNNGAHEQDWR